MLYLKSPDSTWYSCSVIALSHHGLISNWTIDTKPLVEMRKSRAFIPDSVYQLNNSHSACKWLDHQNCSLWPTCIYWLAITNLSYAKESNIICMPKHWSTLQILWRHFIATCYAHTFFKFGIVLGSLLYDSCTTQCS